MVAGEGQNSGGWRWASWQDNDGKMAGKYLSTGWDTVANKGMMKVQNNKYRCHEMTAATAAMKAGDVMAAEIGTCHEAG